MSSFFNRMSIQAKSWMLLVIIYVGFISLGLPDTTLGVTWSHIHTDLKIPIFYAGILSATLTCFSAISGFSSGMVLRRLGTGKLLMVCAFITAFSLLGYAISSSFWLLLLFTIPLGLGQGAIDAGMNYYVAKHYTSRDMSWLHCSWGIGATGGPALVTFILATGASWRWGYLSIAGIQLLFALLFIVSLKLWNYTPEIQKREAPPPPNPSQKVCYTRRFFSCAGMFFLYTGIETCVGLWSFIFLTQCRNIDPLTAGYAVTGYWGMLTLGRFVVGIFANRLGNIRQIRIGLIVAILGGALFTMNIPVLPFIAMGLIGFGLAPFYPAMMHATAERFDDITASTLTGFQCACGMIGTASLPFTFGYIAQITTFEYLPYVVILFASIIFALQFIVDGARIKRR